MREKILKNKTLVIVVAAIVLAAVGFAAGMMVKTTLAKDGGSYIGADKAKTIALETVGVSPSKATFTKVETDRGGHRAVYDIEFYTASNAYDFEIDAKTGDVLEKSSEAITTGGPVLETQVSPATQESSAASDTATQPNTATPSDYIGVDKAKSIAFKHAGVSASAASVTKAKLDSDDGVKTYEIEFVSGNTEYEYEINALTGKIMDYDAERVDSYHDYDHDGDDHYDD